MNKCIVAQFFDSPCTRTILSIVLSPYCSFMSLYCHGRSYDDGRTFAL